MIRIIYSLILISSLVGCSLFGGKQETRESMRVITTPDKAEIFTVKGEKVGETPLVLSREDVAKYASGGVFAFVVKKSGYTDRELVVPALGIDEYTLTLTPLDERHFKEWVLRAYNADTNEMLRKILKIQGLLFLRKNSEAKTAIEEFTKSYESIAAAHTMLASLLMSEGKVNESKSYLLRALSIDKNDETAQRLLNRIESGSVR